MKIDEEVHMVYTGSTVNLSDMADKSHVTHTITSLFLPLCMIWPVYILKMFKKFKSNNISCWKCKCSLSLIHHMAIIDFDVVFAGLCQEVIFIY